jgi:hypothetical protein
MIGAIWIVTSGCGGSDGTSSQSQSFTEVPEVFAALVDRLEDEDKVLHANVVSIQSDNPDESTFEFWIDEGKDVARRDDHLANVIPEDRKTVVADGKAHSFVGNSDPVSWDAPSCEGTQAPATALLLRCEGVESSTELVDSEAGTLRIEMSGSYGPDIANKTWTIALTFDADTLLPLSAESNLWGLLNNEPYESHETRTYSTEFIDRDDLPKDLFELE